MKNFKKINIAINIFSLVFFLLMFFLTTFLMVSYLRVTPTEGSGILIAMFYVIGFTSINFLVLFNASGLIVNYLNKEKILNDEVDHYKQFLTWRILFMVIPVVVFLLQVIIFIILN